jgi:predicted ATPase
MLLGPHSFHRVKLELLGSGACTEHTIGFLKREDIQNYLAMAFQTHDFPPDFADVVFQATEGSPLFMVDLLRYLRERGLIEQSNGRWKLAKLPDMRHDIPGSILSMIKRKLDLLDEQDRKLLAAASVQGCEFDSAVLAGALELEAASVEEQLERLDRVHGLVRLSWEDEFADGTLTQRYAFVHALYQQVLYTGLQPSRRAALGTSLATALDRHQGESNLAPAELACLYEVGRDFLRAARNFWIAAQNAATVFAHREATVLARRGLGLLDCLAETPERNELELPLQTTLGMQLQVTVGFAAREARQAYLRARELCRLTPDLYRHFPVLWGLWLFSKVRSELAKAQEMADELYGIAQELRDPDLALQAHQALAMTAFCRGRPAITIQHVEQTVALYDRERHVAHSDQFGQDPAVICKAFGAVALWILGFPDQARRQSEAAIEMSRPLSPSSQAVALHFAAMLHQLCRDPARVAEYARSASVISAEHGFSFWQAGSSVLGGWALAAGGSHMEGLRRLRQGLHDWSATDSVTYRTYYLGLHAEVLRERGDTAEERRVVDEALTLVANTGESLYEAELLRLSGELHLPDDQKTADELFRRSLCVARGQEAKSLELRAAMSLATLHAEGSARLEARSLLAESLDSFTEGFDTRDVQEAKTILQSPPKCC